MQHISTGIKFSFWGITQAMATKPLFRAQSATKVLGLSPISKNWIRGSGFGQHSRCPTQVTVAPSWYDFGSPTVKKTRSVGRSTPSFCRVSDSCCEKSVRSKASDQNPHFPSWVPVWYGFMGFPLYLKDFEAICQRIDHFQPAQATLSELSFRFLS